MSKDYDPFKNRHKFQDDVWGPVFMNDLERDVIDTPEFRRLFRTSQMGFVELVFQTANHTRGVHGIGACHIANRLVDHLNKNTKELYDEDNEDRKNLYACFDISPAEKILIRLGALLHDISHLPFSHDIEKKTHRVPYGVTEGGDLRLRSWYGHYDKHDDYDRNPLLYILLCDFRKSVLANVLRRYSEAFFNQLKSDSTNSTHVHLLDFTAAINKRNHNDWKPEKDLLPQLLFHLLIYEKPSEAHDPARLIVTGFDKKDGEVMPWHLGPPSLTESEYRNWHDLWYQPFRHDIIGNTLSADLIDYLTRDPERLGTKLGIDLHLLNYYLLVNAKEDKDNFPKQYRCAIDLYDHKRGTTRTFLLNDLFRLLDLRQGIHEKAVMHRVVQSANAMLSRALLLLAEHGIRPEPSSIIVFDDEKKPHSLQSEDLFLRELLNQCENGSVDGNDDSIMHISDAKRLIEKLIDRRVYRPLLIIPGDRAVSHFKLPKRRDDGSALIDDDEFQLRTLAAIVDSGHYSSFLLFVCSCIEKYLEGVFDSISELCKYAKKNIGDAESNEEIVKQAMSVKPSRVIIWAMPYKQLYKDPAVVVALDGCVGQIDEVYKPNFKPRLKDDLTRKRIEKAISDADSKYATLWQLYVFISDGLYYTGILQKLLNKLPVMAGNQSPKRDKHEQRLQIARSLLTVALKVVCNDWLLANERLNDIETKESFLNERMDISAFRTFVANWCVLYERESIWGDPAQGLSTVDIRQYIHEYPLAHPVYHKYGRPCRDSRYKFDVSAEEEWRKAKAGKETDPGIELIRFLGRCGITDPKVLSRLEFRQLREMYACKDTRKRCKDLLDQSENNIPEALKNLWFSGFPYHPEPTAIPVTEPSYPETPSEIKQWILKEVSILRPNVRRRLTEDLSPVVDVLQWASSVNGNVVFEDFLQRMRNETTVMWNDVRIGRLISALKRRWNHPDIENLQYTYPEEDES